MELLSPLRKRYTLSIDSSSITAYEAVKPGSRVIYLRQRVRTLAADSASTAATIGSTQKHLDLTHVPSGHRCRVLIFPNLDS
jgi:hypothetical protein